MTYTKVLVKCGFAVSPECLGEAYVGKYKSRENIEANGGKYRCFKCHHRLRKPTKYKNMIVDYFDNINTSEKAYLLGIIAGDGSIQKGMIYIVSHVDDIETLKHFQKEICKEVPISTKKGEKEKDCRYIYFCSQKMVRDVCKHLNLQPGKKSHKITLPKLDNKLIWDFLRGLMDSDGCIHNPHIIKKWNKTPQCFFSSRSENILQEIKNLTLSIGIDSYLTKTHSLRFSGKNAKYIMQKLYVDSSMFLQRKKSFYEIWDTWEPFKGYSLQPKLPMSDQQLDNIRKSKKHGEKHHNATLTNFQAEEIRKLYSGGNYTHKQLSEKYKVSKSTIANIVNHKTYRK